MSKQKFFFYEAIRDVDIGVIAGLSPDQKSRAEAVRDPDDVPHEMLHSLRLYAKTNADGTPRGRRRGDIIRTDREVSPAYTETIRKSVSRPIIAAAEGGRTFKRVMREKVALPKLRLMGEEELGGQVLDAAVYPGMELEDGTFFMGKRARWADSLFAAAATKVTLPPETAQLLAHAESTLTGEEISAEEIEQ